MVVTAVPVRPAPCSDSAPASCHPHRFPWATPVVALLLAGASMYTLAVQLPTFVLRALSPHPMTPYVVRQYWLTYEHGFVRRALPGHALQLLSGDGGPGYVTVGRAGVGLAVAAVLAVVILAVVLARAASSWAARVAIGAVVVGTPVTAALSMRDLGRPDAVGVVALVALACLPWRRLPGPGVAAAVASVTTVAVATAEFLAVVVVPVAALVLYLRFPEARYRHVIVGVVLAPAAVITALSALLPAPPRAVRDALEAAEAAGAPPPVPVVVDHDSVSRLRYGFVDNLVTYYRLTDPLTNVAVGLLWAAVFVLTVWLAWRLVGARRGVLVAVLVGFAGAAVALSACGIDYRRWWALATVAALSVIVLSGGRRAPSTGDPGTVSAAAVLAGLSVWMYDWPVYRIELF